MDSLVGLLGMAVFLTLAYLASTNRKAIEWRTVVAGLGLQVALGLFVLKTDAGAWVFTQLGDMVTALLAFTEAGTRMVFGPKIVDEKVLGIVFAFQVLPTVVFISSLFTLLYHLGALQALVRVMAWAMMRLMRVSGAESLSSAANVFMGHTEAPLIVKPYLVSMTRSELLCLMSAGMATISGGVMAAYVGMGIDARALITASVMAAPGVIVISKLLLPETEEPLTRGIVRVKVEKTTVNSLDALAKGASEGMHLAINILAMLIAFLAMVALLDGILALANPDLTMARIFSHVFSPVAWLIGIPAAEIPDVATLLGTKLVLNEFVAYSDLTTLQAGDSALGSRTEMITTFALCGFANVGAVAIQIGGIGALAPERRSDLARLAVRALAGGYLASLMSAALASVLIG